MTTKKEIKLRKEIKQCVDYLATANEMHEHLRPKTTKFKVSMNIEVVDVGRIPADLLALKKTIVRVIEGISSGDVICVKELYIEKTGATGVKPKVV